MDHLQSGGVDTCLNMKPPYGPSPVQWCRHLPKHEAAIIWIISTLAGVDTCLIMKLSNGPSTVQRCRHLPKHEVAIIWTISSSTLTTLRRVEAAVDFDNLRQAKVSVTLQYSFFIAALHHYITTVIVNGDVTSSLIVYNASYPVPHFIPPPAS